MGKIVTPTYRVEYRDNLVSLGKSRADGRGIDGKPVLRMAWDCKRDGRPTAANIEAWRKGYNASYQRGGSNEHIAKAFEIIPHIYFAAVVRQRDDKLMAETRAPAFEVM